jgi:hypothetical protein
MNLSCLHLQLSKFHFYSLLLSFISFSNLSYIILTLFMQIVQPFLHTLKDKPG